MDYNADIRSLKSLHTFPGNLFVPYASENWTKSYGLNCMKFWGFWMKKTRFFYKHFWQRVDAVLEDVSAAEIIV